jgi:hypothetical protein
MELQNISMYKTPHGATIQEAKFKSFQDTRFREKGHYGISEDVFKNSRKVKSHTPDVLTCDPPLE